MANNAAMAWHENGIMAYQHLLPAGSRKRSQRQPGVMWRQLSVAMVMAYGNVLLSQRLAKISSLAGVTAAAAGESWRRRESIS
jgi:hypothetical protein